MKYLLDTNVFNYINKKPNSIDIFLGMKNAEFYTIDIILEKEFFGISPRNYDANCELIKEPEDADILRGNQLKEIADILRVKLVPRYASFMLNHTKADGSCFFPPEEGRQYEMTEEIRKLKPNKRKTRPFTQEYDAMVASAAIRNDCVLITEDGALADVVEKYYPENIVRLQDLV